MAGAIKAPISITLDHEQTRVVKDRLILFAQASREGQQGRRYPAYDLANSSGVWQDRATWSIMLTPQPTKDEWYTSNTGDNAKLAKSAFTLSGSSGDWDERFDQQAAGPWIGKKDTSTGGTGITTASYAKNQAVSIAVFSFGRGSFFEIARCGWHSSASIAGGVGLILYSNGYVQVYKGGVYVGDGTVSLTEAPAGTNLQTIHLLLIPGRRRELLILSVTPGGGFSHVFSDITEDEADPEITPAGKFWFQVNEGGSHVQVAPIVFETAGHVVWPAAKFAEVPAAGRTAFDEAYYDLSYQGSETVTASLEEAGSPGTPFVADGVLDSAVVRVDITGGGLASPTIYGATAGFLNEYGVTDDSEAVDLSGEHRGFRLDVPDSNSGAKFSFSLKDPDSYSIAGWDVQSNRPCLLSIDSCSVIDGRTLPPRFQTRPTDAAVECRWDVADTYEALRRYRFRERAILNGLDLLTTLETLVALATGLGSSNIDISPGPGITINPFAAPVAGEWSNAIEVGSTADKELNKLFSAYLGGWFYGFVPGLTGVVFKARPPVTVASAADVTIYDTHEAAIAQLVAEGMSAADARLWSAQRTAHSLEWYSMAPEATEVRITGFDPRERRYIQSFYRDDAAEDPTLAPSLRGDNWQGERLGYGTIDGIITSQSLADTLAVELGDTLTRVRKFCSWESGMLFKSTGEPIWRGDVVEISGYGKFRVRSLSGGSIKEPVSGIATGRDVWHSRRVSYLGEMMTGTESPWGAATGARAIADLAGRLYWRFNSYENPFRAISYTL